MRPDDGRPHDDALAPPHRYARRAGIIGTDLGAWLILLDAATEEMFSLNAVGRMIWRALDEARPEEIVKRVIEACDVSHEVADADVRVLRWQLAEAGLAVAAG